MNVLGLLFDTGLSVLLIVTIGYCSRLSRRIRLLQDSRSELAGMIAQFDQATGRAASSMTELQIVSKRITDALQLKIDKANFLADDLAFLIEKCSKVTAQLELAKAAPLEKAKAASKAVPDLKPFLAAADVTPPKPKPAVFPPAQTSSSDIASSIKSAASLEALLNRLASSTGVSPAPAVRKPIVKMPSAAPARTEAERELLEALKGR